jgi:hypothetical protein
MLLQIWLLFYMLLVVVVVLLLLCITLSLKVRHPARTLTTIKTNQAPCAVAAGACMPWQLLVLAAGIELEQLPIAVAVKMTQLLHWLVLLPPVWVRLAVSCKLLLVVLQIFESCKLRLVLFLFSCKRAVRCCCCCTALRGELIRGTEAWLPVLLAVGPCISNRRMTTPSEPSLLGQKGPWCSFMLQDSIGLHLL